MLSRPLALGLVAAACVVAAGGGAYIATLQHARSDSAIAASQNPATPANPIVPPPVSPAPPPQPSPDDVPAAGEAGPEKTGSRTPDSNPAHPAREAARGPVQRVDARTQPAPAHESVPARGTASQADPGLADQRPGSGSAAQGGQVPAPIPAPSDVPTNDAPRAQPEQTWEELTIPADSVVGLQLETPLNSETARVEDRVDARVTRDIRVNGRVAIPAGTHAIGSVMLAERGGKIRDRSRLGIRFNTLVLPDASRVSLTTETVYREGEAPSTQSSAKIGGAAIGGAIIGAILGGGKGAAIGSGIGAAGGTAATMAGDRHPVVLPVGTPLSVRMQAPVTVTVEK